MKKDHQLPNPLPYPPPDVTDNSTVFDHVLVEQIAKDMYDTKYSESSIWSWVPSGTRDNSYQAGCDPHALQRAILGLHAETNERAVIVKNYFDRCGKQLSADSLPLLLSFLHDNGMRYRYLDQRNLYTLKFVDQDGLVVRAHLALQNTPDPRPLVIVKCGIYCNLGDPSVRKLLMLMYDEGPFHVLLLPGITGSDFEKDNRVLTLGGLDEGRQIIQIAQFIQSDKFFVHNKISSVHVAGFSLGGHATFYSALYNSHVTSPNGQHPIRSFFAGCPVVDLEYSVKHLFRPNVIGTLIFWQFWRQTSDLFFDVPVLGQIFPDLRHRPDIGEVPDLIARGAVDYYSKKTHEKGWGIAPLENPEINDETDFWKWNYFPGFMNQVTSPVFVWASEDDNVVHYEGNTQHLIDYNSATSDSPYHVLVTPKGNHCSTTSTYGWSVTGTVIRSFVLSQSPELMNSMKQNSVRVDLASFDARHRLGVNDQRLSIEWTAKVGKDYAIVEQDIRDNSCRASSRGGMMCYRAVSSRIPLAQLGFSQSDVPTTDPEAQALSRKLNAGYLWANRAGNPVTPTDDAVSVMWDSFDTRTVAVPAYARGE